MSDSTPIPPSGVPQFTGTLATLEQHITALRNDGAKLATQGKSTHTAFQGLSAFYQAPEADRLFATTAPISTVAHDIGADLGTIANALDTYATEVRPLAKRLAELKAEAQTFADAAAADDTWREDGGKVDENNERRDEIATTLEAFWTAEIECHSKIVKLVGGKTYSLNDGSKGDHLYGYKADDLKGAEGLPWGDPVVESVRWYQSYEYVADFATGFVVDGIGGTLKGLGTLVGVYGWDQAGEAWTGLAKLATGIAMVVVPAGAVLPALVGGDKTRKWLMDSQTALKETGKALVAWDQWGSNPGRAAGAVTFNVVTTVFTGGVGAGVSGAGKAGAVAKALSVAGKAGRVIDPTTYVFKAGLYAGTKVGDLFSGLKNLGHVDATLPPGVIELPEGTLRNADGTVTVPADVTPPKGAVEQPNGTYALTHDAVPAGSLRNPDGSDTYLTPEGHVVNGKGDILADARKAPTDIVDNPATRTETPNDTPTTPSRTEVPEPERVLVSVGADTARVAPGGGSPHGDTARLGGSLPDNTPRMSQDTLRGPGGSGDASPRTTPAGGGARDLPGNGADDLSRGEPGGHEAPSRAHADGTGGAGPDDVGRAGDDASDAAGGSEAHGDGAHAADNATPPGGHADDGSGNADNGQQRLTAAALKQIQDQHVVRANSDSAWFRDHYELRDGRPYRRNKNAIVDGARLPILKMGQDGHWIAKHDMPSGPTEIRLKPTPLDRSTVPDDNLPILDKATKDRATALELKIKEESFKRDSSVKNGAELLAAQEAYAKQLGAVPNNSKISEALGEKATELHAIAHLHPEAKIIDLPKTPNGANMFDGAYELPDGVRLIAESKAPKADLDWRQGRTDPENLEHPHLGDDGGAQGLRVKQGTVPYLRTIFAEMTLRGGRDAELAADFREALKRGKLRYVLVKAKDSMDGNYAGLVLEHLKVD